MRYREAVSEARRLVRRSEGDQWRLAELTAEVLAGGKSTREWAEDVGVSHNHVAVLARVWKVNAVIPDYNRPAFADAYAEAKGMPVDRTERRQMEAESSLSKAPVTRRAEVIRNLMQDQEVREHVLRDQPTRSALWETDFALARAKADETPARADEAAGDRLRPLRNSNTVLQVSIHLDNAKRELLRAADEISHHRHWAGEARELTLEHLAEIRLVIEGCETFISTGDLDTELADLLAGEV